MLEHNPRLSEVPNARRRASQKDRPSFNRGPLAQIRDLLLDVEDHVLGIAVLNSLIIVDGFDTEVLGI